MCVPNSQSGTLLADYMQMWQNMIGQGSNSWAEFCNYALLSSVPLRRHNVVLQCLQQQHTLALIIVETWDIFVPLRLLGLLRSLYQLWVRQRFLRLRRVRARSLRICVPAWKTTLSLSQGIRGTLTSCTDSASCMYQPKETNIKRQAAILALEAVALAFLNFFWRVLAKITF